MAELRGLGKRADIVRKAARTMANRLGKPRHGTLPHALFEKLLRTESGPGQLEPAQAPRKRRQELDQGQGEQSQHVPGSRQGRPGAGDLRPGVQVEQSVEYREEAPILVARGRTLAHRLRGNGLKPGLSVAPPPEQNPPPMRINMHRISTLVLLLLAASGAWAQNPRVEFKTSMGSFALELYADKAPKTVANFMQYVNGGFYNGTIFHRVIEGFMIQGGGFEPGMREKTTRAPIENEAGLALKAGLKNELGTVAMARTPNPHSASAQFFINVKDNGFLDYREPSPRGFGYAVFGRVVEGMDTVLRISKAPTATVEQHQNVPQRPITIESVTLKPAK